MWGTRTRFLFVTFVALGFLLSLGQLAMAQTGPEVNGMPEYWTWNDHNTTVWGNVAWGDATSGTYTFYFGDGDEASGTVTDAHYIVETHTYTQTADLWARLVVEDANGLSDEQFIRIHVGNDAAQDYGAGTFGRWAALEDGLRWLYRNQADDGSWSAYADRRTGGTATVLLAFEEHGHRASNPHDEDIYAEYVQKGIEYILAGAVVTGNGVHFSPDYNYELGMGMMAVVETRTPDDSVRVGACQDWTYREVIEGCVDYCEFGQNSDGGWRYTANYGFSDNSVSQWPALGMQVAEEVWDIVADGGVKPNYLSWLAYSQNDGSGGFGYLDPINTVETALTAGGLIGLDYCGVPSDDPDFQHALEFLCGQWDTVGGRYGNFDNYYAMFGVAKAMWLAEPPIFEICPGVSWYDGYLDWLLITDPPADDGHWVADYDWHHDIQDTAWAVIILNGGIIRPVACIEVLDEVPVGVPFPVDGTCSYHPAEEDGRHIVDYRWDWDDNDGLDWDNPDAIGSAFLHPGYDVAGTYTITLRVTDDIGLTDTEQKTVHVLPDPCTNVPPVAVAGGPYSGKPDSTIVLDGSASWDPNPEDPCGDHVAEWHWDRDGDGVYDEEPGDNPPQPPCDLDQPLCELILPGSETTWNIALIVCDTHGACSDSSLARVSVIVGVRDVFITDDDVNSDPRYADAGEPVTLQAVAHCDEASESGVDNLVVRFYKDHPDSGGYQIGEDQVIGHLDVGGSEIVEMEWTVPDSLPHDIYAFADPEQMILEFNESNNIGHTQVNPECVLVETGDVEHVADNITVPIMVTELTGLEVTSADIVFTFNSDVMRGTGVSLDGTLVEGTDWGFMWNDPQPGEVRVGMAGTDPLVGEGALLRLEFEVLADAPCGGCTPLELGLVFNEGVPCVEIPDTTSYCLPMDWVAGQIRYYGCGQLGNTRPPIPDVSVVIAGETTDSDLTDSTGVFQVDACVDSCYTLTPSKEGGETEGITAYDAALILRYMVELEELSDCPIEPMLMYDGVTYCPTEDVLAQQVASDVTGNGEISSYDASVILKYIVGQDVSEFQTGEWTFYCPEREICTLEASVDGQDFVGVLYGDVSGSWNASLPITRSNAIVSVGSGSGGPGELVEIPVSIQGADGFYALDFRVTHDAELATIHSVRTSGLGIGRMLEWNASSGEVHIALAGAEGLEGDGEICRITYEILEEPESAWSELACLEPRADEEAEYLGTESGALALNGTAVEGGIQDAGPFAILGVQPNPLAQTTTVLFRLPGVAEVHASIYDVSGRLVRSLLRGSKNGGVHQMIWDGRDRNGNLVGAGFYYCRIRTGGEQKTTSLIVIR